MLKRRRASSQLPVARRERVNPKKIATTITTITITTMKKAVIRRVRKIRT